MNFAFIFFFGKYCIRAYVYSSIRVYIHVLWRILAYLYILYQGIIYHACKHVYILWFRNTKYVYTLLPEYTHQSIDTSYPYFHRKPEYNQSTDRNSKKTRVYPEYTPEYTYVISMFHRKPEYNQSMQKSNSK